MKHPLKLSWEPFYQGLSCSLQASSMFTPVEGAADGFVHRALPPRRVIKADTVGAARRRTGLRHYLQQGLGSD